MHLRECAGSGEELARQVEKGWGETCLRADPEGNLLSFPPCTFFNESRLVWFGLVWFVRAARGMSFTLVVGPGVVEIEGIRDTK